MDNFFKNRFQEFIFVAALMVAFVAFNVETDIYTPSFPDMMVYFGTNEDIIQMLLSMNFLGVCISSLFLGPASDAYGRKPVLSTGLGLFVLGSIGCSITNSISWMIFFRLIQGLGCGGLVGAGLASLFDIYTPERSSRLVSLLNGIIGGVMALAPIAGNWINLYYGWRMNFYVIVILAVLSFVSILFFVRETLPTEKRNTLKMNLILKNYAALLVNAPFMAHSLIWCMGFSVVIVFIANLSLILVDHLNVSKELFGYYQGMIMGSFFVGSLFAVYAIKRFGMFTTKVAGSLLYLLGVFGLVCATFLGHTNPLTIVLAMACASFGSSMAMTIYFCYSMPFIAPELKGAAMSLTQSLRLFVSSSAVGVAAAMFDGTTKPVALLALVVSCICCGLYVYLYTRDQHVIHSAGEEAAPI